MVARSATGNLGGELVQQLGVGLRIDFAPEQARGALDRELADFPAQALARARALARHFIVRLRHQALRLGRGRALGFLDDFVGALARLIDDLRRAVARLADDFLGACLGFAQILFALGWRRPGPRRFSSGALRWLP